MSDMADVLVAHQRQNAGSCLCGWFELGKSHPEHQAAALSAAGFGPVQEQKAPEVRYVDLTTGEKNVLDEVVAFGAYVHLEAMDENHWWLMVTSGGQSVRVNLYTKRAKITAHADIEDEETHREDT